MAWMTLQDLLRELSMEELRRISEFVTVHSLSEGIATFPSAAASSRTDTGPAIAESTTSSGSWSKAESDAATSETGSEPPRDAPT